MATQSQAEAEQAVDADTDRIQLEVFRYDPDVEEKQDPRFDIFAVPYERGMTVLDALIYARDHYDSSLTFRHSCRMAVCGSDGFSSTDGSDWAVRRRFRILTPRFVSNRFLTSR